MDHNEINRMRRLAGLSELDENINNICPIHLCSMVHGECPICEEDTGVIENEEKPSVDEVEEELNGKVDESSFYPGDEPFIEIEDVPADESCYDIRVILRNAGLLNDVCEPQCDSSDDTFVIHMDESEDYDEEDDVETSVQDKVGFKEPTDVLSTGLSGKGSAKELSDDEFSVPDAASAEYGDTEEYTKSKEPSYKSVDSDEDYNSDKYNLGRNKYRDPSDEKQQVLYWKGLIRDVLADGLEVTPPGMYTFRDLKDKTSDELEKIYNVITGKPSYDESDEEYVTEEQMVPKKVKGRLSKNAIISRSGNKSTAFEPTGITNKGNTIVGSNPMVESKYDSIESLHQSILKEFEEFSKVYEAKGDIRRGLKKVAGAAALASAISMGLPHVGGAIADAEDKDSPISYEQNCDMVGGEVDTDEDGKLICNPRKTRF